jgi:hypothetical protein
MMPSTDRGAQLARMEEARRQTQRQLHMIERQITPRMTMLVPQLGRKHTGHRVARLPTPVHSLNGIVPTLPRSPQNASSRSTLSPVSWRGKTRPSRRCRPDFRQPCCVPDAGVCSALAHEFGAQHQALDRLMPAVDLFGIVSQPDRLDHGALLQGLSRALDLEVLDEDDGLAVGEHIAGGIAHFDTPG